MSWTTEERRVHGYFEIHFASDCTFEVQKVVGWCILSRPLSAYRLVVSSSDSTQNFDRHQSAGPRVEVFAVRKKQACSLMSELHPPANAFHDYGSKCCSRASALGEIQVPKTNRPADGYLQ